MFRQLKKEKEYLSLEVANLKQINNINESKLSEKDDIINELRLRISDYQKQINDKVTEIENMKFKFSRVNIQLEDAKKTNENQKKEGSLVKNLENQVEMYLEKYRNENRKNL